MKKLLVVLISSMLVLSLVGCGQTYQKSTNEEYLGGYFTEIAVWGNEDGHCHIVYANDTKVKYLTFTSGYRFGITPLYNADGTLQVYEEE